MVPCLLLVVLVPGIPALHEVCSKCGSRRESSQVLFPVQKPDFMRQQCISLCHNLPSATAATQRRAPLVADACSPAAGKHMSAEMPGCIFSIHKQEYSVLMGS